MSQSFIRLLDRLLGSLLCLGLTALRRLGDVFRGRRSARHEPRKILFLKLIEQGATVLAQGAVERAQRRVGRDNTYFCVFSENREIVDILDLVPRQNVIEIRHSSLPVFAWDFLAALLRCRREGIDTTIDMEFMTRAPAVFAYLSGAKRRVGLHRFNSEAPYRGDLLTDRVHYNPYLHTADAYSLLVEALDAPAGEIPLLKAPLARLRSEPPRLEPSPEERRRVRGLVESEAGAPLEGPLVLLNPNAGDLLPLRRWPTERFVELGRLLLAESDTLTLAVTGAPGERAAAEAVAAELGAPPRVVCLAGRTTLRELLVLYSLADLLVTNDSGPGHFASLTEVHNIVLFGPETPRLFGPRGGNPHVIWAELACSPCVNVLNHRSSPCGDNLCMQEISVDEVYRQARACLDGDCGSELRGDSSTSRPVVERVAQP